MRVANRWTMVIANGDTVASGSSWPQTPEKIERAQEMALRLGRPVIELVHCGGLYLSEPSRSFPDRTAAGAIIQMIAEHRKSPAFSAAATCRAGGACRPAIVPSASESGSTRSAAA